MRIVNGTMNVTASLSAAWTHMKRTLFPFDFKKWLCLGVIIFVETLFQGGGGRGSGSGNGGPPNVADGVNQAKDWIIEHLAVLVPIGVFLLALFICLGILFIWLRSRGTMMLIRAVALDDPRIGVNWHESRETGFSLFLFRLVFGALAFLAFILFFAAAAVRVLSEASQGTQEVWPYIVNLLPLVIVGICLGLTFWLAETLLRNFVAPLMYRSNLNCLSAWREFSTLCQGNVLKVAAFLAIRFFYHIPFCILALLAGCFTCCIGWLPVIHHTLFAPFYVFDRSYSLCVIESVGPEYRIIQYAPVE